MYQSSVLTATIVQFPRVSHSGSFFALEFLWETQSKASWGRNVIGKQASRASLKEKGVPLS